MLLLALFLIPALVLFLTIGINGEIVMVPAFGTLIKWLCFTVAMIIVLHVLFRHVESLVVTAIAVWPK